MIKEVYVHGKELRVRYESEIWKCYAKKEDIPKNLHGVYPVPKTVIDFMRKHPNKVR